VDEPVDDAGPRVYARLAVEEYLAGVDNEKRHLEAAIAHARGRIASVVDRERRIAELEHRVGQSIVTAHGRRALRQIEPTLRADSHDRAPEAAAPAAPGQPDHG
jgi:hypothetical protein